MKINCVFWFKSSSKFGFKKVLNELFCNFKVTLRTPQKVKSPLNFPYFINQENHKVSFSSININETTVTLVFNKIS